MGINLEVRLYLIKSYPIYAEIYIIPMVNLAELNFFKNFPKELVTQLNSCAKKVQFKPGQEVLHQGQINKSLFFLLTGSLGVFVDGGRVAQLDQRGDLIGEMSLISQQECTATIVAETDAEMYKVDSDKLQQLSDEKGNDLKFSLYKIYSDVLNQKLEETNHKAKHFEELNKDLELAKAKLLSANMLLEQKVEERTAELKTRNEELEQKNTELSASSEKLKDLYLNRDATFQSLETLLNGSLIPLEKSIDQLKGKDGAKSKELAEAEVEIRDAIHRLAPLTQSYTAEKSMKSKKVLLAESVQSQRIVGKMALGGTGVELDIVSSIEEGKEKLAENTYDIVLFDQELKEISTLAKEKNDKTRFVFITSQDIPQYLPSLLSHPFFPNVVSRDEEDRQFTIKNFVTTVSKLASNNLFGMEKYLSWGVEVKEHEVQSSDQRAELNEVMAAYYKKSGMRPRNRDRCVAVSEELLMNAIYDAPRGPDGEALFNHISRTEKIELAPEQRSRFRYATDGMIMAVSVEDPFGALDIRTVFRYLERCYAGGRSLNDGDDSKAGGGHGLHQIIENSDLVVFNVDPGRRTEVIAFFNTDPKVAGSRNPNLHFFTTS